MPARSPGSARGAPAPRCMGSSTMRRRCPWRCGFGPPRICMAISRSWDRRARPTAARSRSTAIVPASSSATTPTGARLNNCAASRIPPTSGWCCGIWASASSPPNPPKPRAASSGSGGRCRTAWSDHSMMRSARAGTPGGIVSLRARAVFRLTTHSNFAGRSTGNSCGLAPCRMRPAYTPARRNASRRFGP